jgi:hypothetical protein
MPDATLHPDGPISVVTLNRPSRPVHGYAVGCGFEWMLNCDMVVAAQDLVCFFPEMQLGHFVTDLPVPRRPPQPGRA